MHIYHLLSLQIFSGSQGKQHETPYVLYTLRSWSKKLCWYEIRPAGGQINASKNIAELQVRHCYVSWYYLASSLYNLNKVKFGFNACECVLTLLQYFFCQRKVYDPKTGKIFNTPSTVILDV